MGGNAIKKVTISRINFNIIIFTKMFKISEKY